MPRRRLLSGPGRCQCRCVTMVPNAQCLVTKGKGALAGEPAWAVLSRGSPPRFYHQVDDSGIENTHGQFHRRTNFWTSDHARSALHCPTYTGVGAASATHKRGLLSSPRPRITHRLQYIAIFSVYMESQAQKISITLGYELSNVCNPCRIPTWGVSEYLPGRSFPCGSWGCA
jgi:hypothetical protein